MEWNWLAAADLSLRSPTPFFHVAIDCPGYGRSAGDRQTVRSAPGSLLTDVVTSLGKPRAFCLVGCSQGSCSVFNAVLEHPRLSAFVAAYNPVGHDVKRYTSIRQPTFLLFDTEDTGHPAKVGRLMQKYLPVPHYFEFTRSEEIQKFGRQGWQDCLNSRMAGEILRMFAAHKGFQRASQESWTSLVLPNRTSLAGGVLSWNAPGPKELARYTIPLNLDGGGCNQNSATNISSSSSSLSSATNISGPSAEGAGNISSSDHPSSFCTDERGREGEEEEEEEEEGEGGNNSG
eukprot:CAMPEP_0175102802 /NCGR_PEP_ID=MMETSP0086_2-20121207/8672_1 /TAXON_ID=136419 /ORGANISM="Unknown Unknown, Strain D1" /LENGTH=288 /DNA_ID=CAMNT_0016377719 /DNA_START=141 /DNA_END=1004 /DNA_ORIENTATION=+